MPLDDIRSFCLGYFINENNLWLLVFTASKSAYFYTIVLDLELSPDGQIQL
jgi:hypothetical protein